MTPLCAGSSRMLLFICWHTLLVWACGGPAASLASVGSSVTLTPQPPSQMCVESVVKSMNCTCRTPTESELEAMRETDFDSSLSLPSPVQVPLSLLTACPDAFRPSTSCRSTVIQRLLNQLPQLCKITPNYESLFFVIHYSSAFLIDVIYPYIPI